MAITCLKKVFSFFNETIEYKTEQYEQAVYRWRARNDINGLMYGNGGISSWTKTFVQNMRTHEASEVQMKLMWSFALMIYIGQCTTAIQLPILEKVQNMLSVQALEKV